MTSTKRFPHGKCSKEFMLFIDSNINSIVSMWPEVMKAYSTCQNQNNTIILKSVCGQQLFCGEELENCSKNGDKYNFSESRKKAAREWKIMSPARKEHYNKAAETKNVKNLQEWRHFVNNNPQTISQVKEIFDNPMSIYLPSSKKHILQLYLGFLGKGDEISHKTPKRELQKKLVVELYGIDVHNKMCGKRKYQKKITPKEITTSEIDSIPTPPSPTAPNSDTDVDAVVSVHELSKMKKAGVQETLRLSGIPFEQTDTVKTLIKKYEIHTKDTTA